MNDEVRRKLINLLVEFTYLEYKGNKDSIKELIELQNTDQIVERIIKYTEENKND